MVHRFALLVEYGVGKIVILVDDKVERQLSAFRLVGNFVKFGTCIGETVNFLNKPFGVESFVVAYKTIELRATIGIKLR